MAANHQSELPVGTVLDAKFRVTREVGRGGMAVIYEAVHVDIGKRVALKLLSADLVTSRVVRERFLREARAAAAIRSPHICEVYDSGMYAERPFLVMELLEGESLYERLTRVRRLDLTTTLDVIEQTARGLTKAHQAGVVHRDLKPENIFLTHDEEGRLLVKLVDFGLAKFYENNPDGDNVRLTREGALFGTPAYMSPEQAKGLGEVDHRADLWALGCIVYECLTGKTVWNVDQGVAMILAQIAAAPLPKPSLLFPELPASFDDWFARALSRIPEQRFQTPRELADSLRQALWPTPGQAERVSDTDLAPAVAPIASFLPSPVLAFSSEPAVPSEPPLKPREAGPSPWVMRMALATLALALGGYVAWLLVFQPQGTAADAGSKPLEHEPYALKVNSAQRSLSDGNPTLAIQQFQAALDLAQAPVARSLLQRCQIVEEQRLAGGNRCQVTALGRPRPFNIVRPSSRPSLALTARGPLIAWADNHLHTDQRQVSAAWLDSSLRRVTVPLLISPEAAGVGDPLLVALNNGVAAVYTDSGAGDPGLFVRSLGTSSDPVGVRTRLSTEKRTPFGSGVARAPEGDLWFVWEETNADGSASLVVRQLSPTLAPAGPAVRVATLAPRFRQGVTRGSTKPTLAVTAKDLRIVFALELSPVRYQITQLLIERTDPKLTQGVAGEAQASTGDHQPEDLHLGRLSSVSDSDARNSQPQLDCTASGECFVAWDTGSENASVAYLPTSGDKGWRRPLSGSGARPVIAHNGTSTAVIWYEDARLKLAALTHAGVGPASVLTRVTGVQPHPTVIPGESAGRWYIAWRDFEAGHYEAFVLRAQCQ